MRILFDEEGGKHVLRNGMLDGTEFRGLSVDMDLPGFLIRNRGWVLVDLDVEGATPVTVHFYTPNVESGAIQPVIDIISGFPGGGPVAIRYWYGGWAYERFASAHDAVFRIENVIDFREQAITRKQTMTREVSEDHVMSHRIERMRQIWEAANGVLSVHMLDWMRQSGLMRRTLMVELQQENLVYRYFGDGFRDLLGSRFCEERLNTVQDGSGSDYARQVVTQYYDVIAASRPYYDRITTSLADRNRDDDSPMHYRYFDYERGIFPCMTEDGKLVMVGHTENVPNGIQLA
jgi:hypothetical protein